MSTARMEKRGEQGKPLWGFCRVKVENICRLWTAYREGSLELTDIRTWFAAHELVMRRCTLEKGRFPRFEIVELGQVTGILNMGRLRASIRRLERCGLMSWSTSAIGFNATQEGSNATLTDLAAMLSAVVNSRRTLPIPRHTISLLARTRRPVLFATVLGQLLRCMYYRSGECRSWGTCKASWVAKTFGVDTRNVKAARGELERLGWMRQTDSAHWHRQRFGGTFVISLAWDRRTGPDVEKPGDSISPPRTEFFAPKSPPPVTNRNLPTGINHQKPVAARHAGVSTGRGKEGKASLSHILPRDLTDPVRKAALFGQAVAQNLLRETVADRLRFFSAAARARRLGRSNPCGFFSAILRKGLWRHIAIADEEVGRRELNEHPEVFYGEEPRKEPIVTIFVGADSLNEDPIAIRTMIQSSLAESHELPTVPNDSSLLGQAVDGFRRLHDEAPLEPTLPGHVGSGFQKLNVLNSQHHCRPANFGYPLGSIASP